MKLKTPLLVMTVLTSSFMAYSQQGAKFQNASLIPQIKTPETAGMEKYVSVPVSGNTGTPDISIPIYTLSYGGIDVPISLNYDASGVKVNDIASEVGLKWSLSYGGAISRIVRGGNDEGEIYGAYTSSVNARGFYLHNGFGGMYTYMEGVASGSQISQFGLFVSEVSTGLKDTEPDLFSFNLPGGSQRFFFDENRNVIQFTTGDNKIKEYFDANRDALDSRFYKWEVTATDGMLYTFGNTPKAVEKSFSGALYNTLSHYNAQAWKLSKIYNPVSKRSVDFVYRREAYVEAMTSCRTDNSCVQNTDPAGNQCSNYNDPSALYSTFVTGTTSIGGGGSELNIIAQKSDNKVLSAQIDSIKAGNDILIRFYRSERTDLRYQLGWETSKPTRVDSVRVFHSGVCVRRIRFNYIYQTSTISDPVTTTLNPDRADYAKKRLILSSVEELDASNKKIRTYAFEYANLSGLPARTSFAQDKWGYYNAANTNESLYPKYERIVEFPKMANRRVSTSTVANGTLLKIVYPTKGSVNFEYEPHVHSSQTYVEKSWQQQYLGDTGYGAAVGNTTKTITVPFTIQGSSNNYRLKGTVGKATWLYQQTDCNALVGTAYQILNSQGTILFSYGYSDVDGQNDNNNGTVEVDLALSALSSGANYTLKVFGYSEPNASSLCYWSNLAIERLDPVAPSSNDFLVGGLRVSRVVHKDELGQQLLEKSYTYSNPKLLFNPEFLYRMSYDYDITCDGLIAIKPTSPMNWGVIRYNQGISEGKFVVLSTSDPFTVDFTGSHIAYGEVTENTGNGTIVNYFHLPKTYSELNGEALEDNNFPPKPLFQSELAGRVHETWVKDANGFLVSKDMYYYNVVPVGAAVQAVNFSVINGKYIASKFYSLKPERVRLTKTTLTKNFSGTYVNSETKNFFDGATHGQVTRVVSGTSTGDSLMTRTYFAPDLSSEPQATNLVAQNRIVPLKYEQFIKRAGTSNYVSQQSSLLKYKNDATTYGVIQPSEIRVIAGGNERIESTFERFDNAGNVIQYKNLNGLPVTMIWSYNRLYPVAQVVNATFAQVATALAISEATLENFNSANLATLTTLRTALPNAHITLYSYNPSIGIATKTDPNGQTTSFLYDGANRLKTIKDSDNNVLSVFEYNYMIK